MNERLTPDQTQIRQNLIDALDAHVCLVDQTGQILAVNLAWQRFARDNGCSDGMPGIGLNYLEVCWRAAKDGDLEAGRARQAILSVLSGRQPQVQVEYPCNSPTELRWFLMSVNPYRLDPDQAGPPDGAIIEHTNITRRRIEELDRQAVWRELGPDEGAPPATLACHRCGRFLIDGTWVGPAEALVRRPRMSVAATRCPTCH